MEFETVMVGALMENGTMGGDMQGRLKCIIWLSGIRFCARVAENPQGSFVFEV